MGQFQRAVPAPSFSLLTLYKRKLYNQSCDVLQNEVKRRAERTNVQRFAHRGKNLPKQWSVNKEYGIGNRCRWSARFDGGKDEEPVAVDLDYGSPSVKIEGWAAGGERQTRPKKKWNAKIAFRGSARRLSYWVS